MPNFNRKGSQIVEATMVLPITILIFSALVCLMMAFYINLTEQIDAHAVQRDELYQTQEVMILRMKDSLSHAAGEVTEQ
jgi:hypothetical protein